MSKQLKTKLALFLILATQSPLLFALQHQSVMSWPVLAGESINDVARLYYPKNKYMQQQFVAATVKLNSESQPHLNPASAFEQETMIDIPDIKVLSNKSKHKVEQAQLSVAQSFPVDFKPQISAKLQADYDSLVTRNAFFTQELEKLNVKLTHLQHVFTALNSDFRHFIDNVEANAKPQVAPAPKAAPVVVQQPATPAPNALPISTPVATKTVNAQINVAQAIVPVAAPERKEQAAYLTLLMPILIAALVMGLSVCIAIYSRRKAEKIRLAADASFTPLEKNAFADGPLATEPPSALPDAQSALNENEFVGSITVLDAEEEATPAAEEIDEEETALALEQAKIYVNLGRNDDAIKLLNAYIQAEPKAALPHWLYLLDIYRNTDQKEAFLESAKQLHHTFNVAIPQWEKSNVLDGAGTSIEEYDYIIDKVTKLWADCAKEANKIAETKSYLDQLLMDNRNSERNGFSMEVFEEIMLLRNMLEAREKLAQEV